MRKQTSTNYLNEQLLREACPFNRVLNLLGSRWKAAILWKAHRVGSRRFSDFKSTVPDVSDKMLSRSLRELVETGLLTKHLESRRPLIVTYALTEHGRSLLPILQAMDEWGLQSAPG